ncbi:unnamed protein product [Adineta ricciae]|uniref:Uncharacterized protein n=1 Tax=Adineta ricciae TaxID=249248 RepID=A0A813P2U1_ADIRI|nr:unnamed protein product [Adineta ricciae]
MINSIAIKGSPVSLDYDHKWETGYHPFPEMSRFLNSHSRVHHHSSRPHYSFLGYLCSMADDEEQLNQVLTTFGKKYRSLITTIIEKDCASLNPQRKRMTINNKRKTFPRKWSRRVIDLSY